MHETRKTVFATNGSHGEPQRSSDHLMPGAVGPFVLRKDL